MLSTVNIPIASEHSLCDWIESAALYEFKDQDEVRFVPVGRMEILFQVQGEFLHKSKSQDGWVKRPPTFLGGMHTSSYVVKPVQSKGKCLGITLKPEYAHWIIQEDLSSFQNSTVDLRDIFGCRLDSLEDKIFNIKNEDEVLIHFNEFISKNVNVKSNARHNELIVLALSGMNPRTVKELSERASLSESHFRKLFRQYVGLSPKKYFKIRRVQQAIKHIHAKDVTDLTALAYGLGYFDQAHFIREFKSVTGSSPGRFCHSSE